MWLQDIKFSPPLPKAKVESLKKIQFEACFKVALRFSVYAAQNDDLSNGV